MAEASACPQRGDLRAPYPKWVCKLEGVERILDPRARRDLPNSQGFVARGCLDDAVSTVTCVQTAYGLWYGEEQGVVAYDFRHVHCLCWLAKGPVSPEKDGDGTTRASFRAEVASMRRLCCTCVDLCADLCGGLLKWLEQEAIDRERGKAAQAASSLSKRASSVLAGCVAAAEQSGMLEDPAWPPLERREDVHTSARHACGGSAQ